MHQLSCIVETTNINLVTEQLFAVEALSVSNEVTNSTQSTITALFETSVPPRLDFNYAWEPFNEDDWKKNDTFILDSFTLNCPTHIFGNGDHASTQLALKALPELVKKYTPSSIIDVGCGSGILAIKASLLNVPNIDAFDYDPVAIEISKENASLASITNINFHTADLNNFNIPKRYDLVLANIPIALIEDSLETLLKLKNTHGILFLSGFTKQWERSLSTKIHSLGYTSEIFLTSGDWYSLLVV